MVADDHVVLAHALQIALERTGVSVVVTTALTPGALLKAIEDCPTEVLVLDLYGGVPGENTIPAIAPITARGVRIVVLTGSDRPGDLGACLDAGARAVLHKREPLSQIVQVIRAVAEGRCVMAPEEREALIEIHRQLSSLRAQRARDLGRLSAREREVLLALMRGDTASAIAAEGAVSVRTVRTQIQSILMKLGVNSQLAAVAVARDAGWEAR
jgi:DNA-binding NarL/FixJ family response regulator